MYDFLAIHNLVASMLLRKLLAKVPIFDRIFIEMSYTEIKLLIYYVNHIYSGI
jgi:hypothetical protein